MKTKHTNEEDSEHRQTVVKISTVTYFKPSP